MSGPDAEERPPSSDARLASFFEQYDAFDKERERQKSNGENDYSLLRSVFRRLSDEVDLHSRFLFSMLNPAASHYRGSVFGEAFMTVVGHANWLDWSTTWARREHECIDLYLTDGKRHVLIENKIHAIDQPGQVRRYIDQIRYLRGSSDVSVEAGDLLFVYLSNGREGPTAQSVAPYALRGAFIVDEAGKPVARFVNAHYRSQVLPWITTCLESVKSIDNLRYAFSEYEGVVRRITRTYKSRVMNLEDFLLEASDEPDGQSRIGAAFKIADEVPAIKAKWLERMFIEGLNDLLDEDVRYGRLVAIADGDSEALKPYQFEPVHARSFFQASVANKGRFWRVAAGPARDAVALAVLFGKSALHVGLLPIRRGAPDCPALAEFTLGDGGQTFAFRQHGPVNARFKGLVSWMVPLDKEMERLARFEGSRAASVVKALVTYALESNALFRPAEGATNEGLSR